MFGFKRLHVAQSEWRRRIVIVLMAPMLATGGSAAHRVHAQSEAGWVACPFVFDAATQVILARLKTKLSSDEFAGMGDLVCTSVKLYLDYQRRQPKQVPLSPQTAHEIFCANSQSLEYCGKAPLMPPSFKQALRQGANETFVGGWAAKCAQTNPTAEGCAVAILIKAIIDAEKK